MEPNNPTIFMKKIFTLIAFFAVSMMAMAQSTMVVTKTDGSQIKIKVSEIQDVTFPEVSDLNVDISYYTKYWLHPEQWMQLEAIATKDGSEVYADIQWQSTDEKVATVDPEGVVTGVADGKCDICAVVDGQSLASIEVNVVAEPQFDLQVTNIGNRTCNYSITPKNNNIRYYHNMRVQSGSYSVDNFDQYGSEEQNMLHFTYSWFDFASSLYGMTREEYMNTPGMLASGKKIGTQEDFYSDGLAPGTTYCFYAFGLDEAGNLVTPVEVKKFDTTKPAWYADLTFECKIDEINEAGAKFTITPSDPTKPYFVCTQRESYVSYFIENDKLNDMANDLAKSFKPEVYKEAYCEGTCQRSTDDFLASVRKNNDYYVIVFGYDDGQTSPVALFRLPFTELYK